MLSTMGFGMILAIIICAAIMIEIIIRVYITHNITPHDIVLRMALMSTSVIIGMVFFWALIVLLGGFVFYAFNRWEVLSAYFNRG